MPRYRVELQRRCPKRFGYNPFIPGAINGKSEVLIRTWEFDAADEEEVMAYFKEAQDKKLPNVIGFDLRSIKEIEGEIK